jgi:hypothetical protein
VKADVSHTEENLVDRNKGMGDLTCFPFPVTLGAKGFKLSKGARFRSYAVSYSPFVQTNDVVTSVLDQESCYLSTGSMLRVETTSDAIRFAYTSTLEPSLAPPELLTCQQLECEWRPKPSQEAR